MGVAWRLQPCVCPLGADRKTVAEHHEACWQWRHRIGTESLHGSRSALRRGAGHYRLSPRSRAEFSSTDSVPIKTFLLFLCRAWRRGICRFLCPSAACRRTAPPFLLRYRLLYSLIVEV